MSFGFRFSKIKGELVMMRIGGNQDKTLFELANDICKLSNQVKDGLDTILERITGKASIKAGTTSVLSGLEQNLDNSTCKLNASMFTLEEILNTLGEPSGVEPLEISREGNYPCHL